MNRTSLILLVIAALAGAGVYLTRSQRARPSIDRLLQYLRAGRPWMAPVGLALAAVATALWVGVPARRVARDARVESERVGREAAFAAQMRRDFVPATAQETAEWERTKSEIADFGVPTAMKLTLAHAVARLAEDAGMSSVRVRFAPADSLTQVQPRVIAGQQFPPASYGLDLRAQGDLESAARLLVALPPSVDVQRLTVDSAGVGSLLTVYEPASGEAPGAQR